MINLIVTPKEALRLLSLIPHQTCQKAIANQWRVNTNRHVPAQSVCWLFCWGKTGLGSIKAAKEAQKIFDDILDTEYSFFDASVPHQWARIARYAVGDLEKELDTYLKG